MSVDEEQSWAIFVVVSGSNLVSTSQSAAGNIGCRSEIDRGSSKPVRRPVITRPAAQLYKIGKHE